MIQRLLSLKSVVTGGGRAMRLSLLLGVACCWQTTGVRADERIPSDRDGILTTSFFETPADYSSEYDVTLVGYSLATDEAAVQSGSAVQDPYKSTIWSSDSSTPQPLVPEADKKSWIPQGVVPYIGPRTPDAEKDRGIGWPLEGRGWRTRPLSISGFSGFTVGEALIPGHVIQQPSFYGGLNLGWDYDHFWGIEKRLGFGALSLVDGNHHSIPGPNLSITGEYRLMYYPLGDARVRPFVTAGLGWSDFYFQDDHADKHLDTVGMVPFGLGTKYLYSDNVALRVDVIDELTFGAGSLSTFHYVALTAGVEIRYSRHLLKMPWHKDESNEH